MELYQHPERIKLEKKARAGKDNVSFDSFAGKFDITIIKIDKTLTFTKTVRRKARPFSPDGVPLRKDRPFSPYVLPLRKARSFSPDGWVWNGFFKMF